MRTTLKALAVGVALGVVAGACGPLGAPCARDGDCGSSGVCLPIKMCAFHCARDSHCPSDMKCSVAGGCVPKSGCGADADCPTGERCLTRGLCTGSAVDGGRVLPDGGILQSCGGQKFQATPVQANMLVVLDHSGSMMETIGGVTKWQSAKTAVQQLTTTFQGPVRFGLNMFSTSAMTCDPGGVVIDIADNTAAAIATALPATADGNMTPVGAALQVASGNTRLTDATRANYVLLVTDGKENCGGNPVAQVKALFARGIRTYSVGFGGQVDATRLNQMAIEGGTARMGSVRYYQADNAAALNQAMQAIGQGAAGCDYTLAQAPPDPTKLYVAIDGQFVTRDTSHRSGFDYDAAANRVTLYGLACDAVATTPGAKVSVIYGCPDDTLVEVGPGGGPKPDGGWVWDLDAGIIN